MSLFRFGRVTLREIRVVIWIGVLLVAAVVLPVAHGLHETVDHDCTLCQLRHSSIGDVAQVQTVAACFETRQRIRENLVDAFDSQYYLPSGSRAPPA